MEQSKSTHPLSNIKAGDLLYNGTCYRRALSDVLYPHLGESATVVVSYSSSVKDHEDLKVVPRYWTLYELKEENYKIHKELPILTKEEAKAKLKELTGEETDIV